MQFDTLTPDTVLTIVEQAAGVRLTSLLVTLPSYVNRVYELQSREGERLIAKFYRPGRWSKETILEEHRFLADCAEAEIPVVTPRELPGGGTLYEQEGMFIALFPKRGGRKFEITDERDWERLGSLVARMHLCGEKRPAHHRTTLHPAHSTTENIEYLCQSVIPAAYRERWRSSAMRIVETGLPVFDTLEIIRTHGDCHQGNILDRLDEGLLLIDFDDMVMGPPVNDIWLLLPDRYMAMTREVELLLRGYERFRRFDRGSLRCIELLRAMRMIYFLAWTSIQYQDARFRHTFTEWGSDTFWQKEIRDLQEQFGFICESLEGTAEW